MDTEPTKDAPHDHTPSVGWGTPAPPPRRPAQPDGWSTLRRATFWAVVALAVPAIGVGLYAIAEDMAETTDDWHGFGIAIGLMLAVPCLVFAVLAGFGLRSMRRHGADGGRPQAVALGLLLVMLLLLAGLTSFVLLPVALGTFLLLSVLADRSRRA